MKETAINQGGFVRGIIRDSSGRILWVESKGGGPGRPSRTTLRAPLPHRYVNHICEADCPSFKP